MGDLRQVTRMALKLAPDQKAVVGVSLAVLFAYVTIILWVLH